jgi:hypothetical protein
MKFIARIFLFLFIASLSTPAIVTMIEKSCDTSVLFNLSEKNTLKEIKILCTTDIEFKFLLGHYNKSSLISF